MLAMRNMRHCRLITAPEALQLIIRYIDVAVVQVTVDSSPHPLAFALLHASLSALHICEGASGVSLSVYRDTACTVRLARGISHE